MVSENSDVGLAQGWLHSAEPRGAKSSRNQGPLDDLDWEPEG